MKHFHGGGGGMGENHGSQIWREHKKVFMF